MVAVQGFTLHCSSQTAEPRNQAIAGRTWLLGSMCQMQIVLSRLAVASFLPLRFQASHSTCIPKVSESRLKEGAF